MPTYRHLWSVLPQQEKAFNELVKKAPKDIETYRKNGATPGRSVLEILRLYAVLGDHKFVTDAEGAATSRLKYVDSAFWAPLQGLHHVREDKKPAVHRLQCGSTEDPDGLLCTHAACCIPSAQQGGPNEYVVAFVCGYDAASSTYAVLHTPNAADATVLAQQQQQQPEDARVQAAALAPRYYEVPAARLAAFPGVRCMFRQYVKGQEVLVRWAASVLVTEPITHDFLRPRGQWRDTKHTTLLYPAEIVGGHGLEHVEVRYLSARGAGEQKVHTVHKRDVALPPEVGEPDEAERKRQRKARKRREQERAAAAAAAPPPPGEGAARPEGGGDATAALLPTPLPSALAYPFPEGPESFAGLAPLSKVLSLPDLQRAAEWTARVDAAGVDGAPGGDDAARGAPRSPLPQGAAAAGGGSGGPGEGATASSGGEGGGSGGRASAHDGAYDDGGADVVMLMEDESVEAPAAVGAPPAGASAPAEADHVGAPTPLRMGLLTDAPTAEPEEPERPPSPPAAVGTVKCVARFAFAAGATPPPAMTPPSPQSEEAAASELAEWRRLLGLPPLVRPPTGPSHSALQPAGLAGVSTAEAMAEPEGSGGLAPRVAGAPPVRFGLMTKRKRGTHGVLHPSAHLNDD